MIEAVILAGGRGTRLNSVVNDRPKPMALVNNKPFLEYLIHDLSEKKVSHVVLSVGYLAEQIKSHFGSRFKDVSISYAHEQQPLGTGGGIALAAQKISGDSFILLNGDTFVEFDLHQLVTTTENPCKNTILVKYLNQTHRYGTINFQDNRLLSFNEKNKDQAGYINTGVYHLKKSIFDNFKVNQAFSFEQDFMSDPEVRDEFRVVTTTGKFIDIGIPEDYQRASTILPKI